MRAIGVNLVEKICPDLKNSVFRVGKWSRQVQKRGGQPSQNLTFWQAGQHFLSLFVPDLAVSSHFWTWRGYPQETSGSGWILAWDLPGTCLGPAWQGQRARFGHHLPDICWLVLAVGSLRPDTPWTLNRHGFTLPHLASQMTP